MPTYIQLLRLTPEGRANLLQDSEFLLRSQAGIRVPGVVVLGTYGVLGQYDFVNIVEAPDNEAVARFSLELGVRAGAHIVSLPAIPIARLEARIGGESPELEAEVTLEPPEEASERQASTESRGGPRRSQGDGQ